MIDFALLIANDSTIGRGCDIKRIAKDAPDTYEQETVLLLKHLPKLRQVKEARSLVYELFADQEASPDIAATQAVNLDPLADEVWYLWKRYHEIRDFLLQATSREHENCS